MRAVLPIDPENAKAEIQEQLSQARARIDLLDTIHSELEKRYLDKLIVSE
ncbi:hypothetical protein ACIPYQ_37400 [Streptomyces sp. NPDC090045]